MLKQTSGFRSMLVFVMGASLLCSPAFAQGDHNRMDRGQSSRGDPRGDLKKEDVRDDHRRNVRQSSYGHNRYHYRDGRWYSRGWFGWEFAVAALSIGAMVETLPPHHTTVVVENTSYYYDNAVYYRQMPDGVYVVVDAPRGR